MKVAINKSNNYKGYTDRELINLAINGEQEAYTKLVSRHQIGLSLYVSEFLTGLKTRDNYIEEAIEPEDICQEAFQKAFSKIKEYNPKYEFSTWIFNIAKNVAIDHIRKNKNNNTDNKDVDSGIVETVNIGSGINNSPEDEMISTQEYQRLLELIDKMDPKYKVVAELRFIKEYAYDEIALELNLQLNTVRTRIKRAKEQLIELINIEE